MAQAKPIPVPLVPPPSKKSKDRAVVYIGIATLALLLSAFATAWYFVKDSPQMMFRSAYLDSGPMVIVVDGWAIATRMSVQTSKDDSEWAVRNRMSIISVLQKTLAESDPSKMIEPAEVNIMQGKLRDACNRAFATDKVQGVMFTEFVVKKPV